MRLTNQMCVIHLPNMSFCQILAVKVFLQLLNLRLYTLLLYINEIRLDLKYSKMETKHLLITPCINVFINN